MSEQMNMQKIVELLKYFRNETYQGHRFVVDDAIAFLENEMKYPTREEINKYLKYRFGLPIVPDTIEFINTPKEAKQ